MQAPTPKRISSFSSSPPLKFVAEADKDGSPALGQDEWGEQRGELVSCSGDGRPVARHVTFADDVVGVIEGDFRSVGYATPNDKAGATASAIAADIEGHSSSIVRTIPPQRQLAAVAASLTPPSFSLSEPNIFNIFAAHVLLLRK